MKFNNQGDIQSDFKIAVVIPAYKVKNKILKVIQEIGPEVTQIIVVDDACPQHSGKHVTKNCKDLRVKVMIHSKNMGVGGAVKTGYKEALENSADIIIKIDGDGQMNGSDIGKIIQPIIEGESDYAKGNRFYHLKSLNQMPVSRIIGNAILTLFSKISTGYWKISDPNNGFTAINSQTLNTLPLNKIHNRYFFESDMLFRLYCDRRVVKDIPIESKYGDENSSLSILHTILTFPYLHVRNFCKRFLYNYVLRDTSTATFELPCGLMLFLFGLIRGISTWLESQSTGVPSLTGTVVLSSISLILGLQLILSFINHDIANSPRK